MSTKIGIFIGGILSLTFYRILITLNRPYLHRTFKKKGSTIQWHPFSQWLQTDLQRVFAMMLIGPRWNCGGILAVTDTIQVKKNIKLRSDQADSSAQFWTAVIYDLKFNTVSHIGKRNASKPETIIKLPVGEYLVAVRYYKTKGKCQFPEICIDDTETIPARDASDEQNNYQNWLGRLADHPGRCLYFCMHYHAWAFLYLNDWFNKKWLNRVYLPVGNPETEFTYGVLNKGDRLVSSRLPDPKKETVFFSVYNRASLPVYWTELTESNFSTPQMECHGTWLLRKITDETSDPVFMQLQQNDWTPEIDPECKPSAV